MRLRKLRQRDVALLALSLSVLGLGAWYQFSYAPGRTRIAELEASIARQDVELRRAEEARRSLPELRERVAELERERLVFLSELPRSSELAAVLDDVRTMAERSGVTVTGLGQVNAPEAIAGVRALGFTVAATGGFGAVMDFLASFERTRRYTKLPQIGLSVAQEGAADPRLNANIGFTVYVFVGNEPGDPR
jgi:Tfp pilus assembly protein PilO